MSVSCTDIKEVMGRFRDSLEDIKISGNMLKCTQSCLGLLVWRAVLKCRGCVAGVLVGVSSVCC